MESRFLRLADLVAQRMPWALEELEESGAPEETPQVVSPAGTSEKRVVSRQEGRKAAKNTDEEKKVVKTVANKEEEKKDGRKDDDRKEKKERASATELQWKAMPFLGVSPFRFLTQLLAQGKYMNVWQNMTTTEPYRIIAALYVFQGLRALAALQTSVAQGSGTLQLAPWLTLSPSAWAGLTRVDLPMPWAFAFH
eukprot:Skav208994  [mRNA]  locus=scaffold2686:118162:119729:+ [translate_table: standard]